MKIEKILGLDSYDYIYSAGYRYRDIKFCLKSTTVSPVKWCNIYFNGYYDIVDNFFQCDYTINYIVSKKMYRVAEKALDFSNVAQIKSHHYRFAFKFALEGLDDFILFYPNFKFYIIYNLSKKTFYIISDGTEDDNRFEPARMIREITTRELEKQGYFVMHAAALEKNGKTIILTGKKDLVNRQIF